MTIGSCRPGPPRRRFRRENTCACTNSPPAAPSPRPAATAAPPNRGPRPPLGPPRSRRCSSVPGPTRSFPCFGKTGVLLLTWWQSWRWLVLVDGGSVGCFSGCFSGFVFKKLVFWFYGFIGSCERDEYSGSCYVMRFNDLLQYGCSYRFHLPAMTMMTVVTVILIKGS